MSLFDYHLRKPLDAIIFDCDGTLSDIEGIDWLANSVGVGEKVSELTNQAMSHSGINPALYEARLSLVRPNLSLVTALGDAYYQSRTEALDTVLSIFRKLGKSLYLLSAGVNPAVMNFGKMLKFESDQVTAVNVSFDQAGEYQSFDHDCPLISKEGKYDVVSLIKKNHARLGFVGDGMNDVVTKPLVSRFIGYGGVFYRENVRAASDYYLMAKSFLPLLPLLLTQSEAQGLASHDKNAYGVGVQMLEAGAVVA